MKNFRIIVIVVFLLVLFIFSVSLLAGGSTQFNRTTLSYKLVPNNCTLVTPRLVVPYDSGTWLGVWNGNVIYDVFSIQPTMQLATASVYLLNATYPCLCDPNRPAVLVSVWSACYLNRSFNQDSTSSGWYPKGPGLPL